MEKTVSLNTDRIESYDISVQTLSNRITNRIRDSLELTEILSTTVAEVRSYLKTDRVMIYQFCPDGHGWVISESLNEANLPSLQGLHFPKEDIPPQTIELMVTTRQRTVVNMHQNQTWKSQLDNQDTGMPLQSIKSSMSSIDPCHYEYLLALGVKSSVVVPIVLEQNDTSPTEEISSREKNQLWGLLVSHNAGPRDVTDQELDFIQSVVDQVSIAISQSVLLERVREQARREANVNRVTSILYTTATIQLEQALAETVSIYEGSGGRLYLLQGDDQDYPKLFTHGPQPSLLPGEKGERQIEEHAVWQHFLKSTLGQEPGKQAPWSVSWMKEAYCYNTEAERISPEKGVWAIKDIYREPLLRSLTPRFTSTDIRGVLICPLHYGKHLIGCLSIFREERDTQVAWAEHHIPDTRHMVTQQSFQAWFQSNKGAIQEWTMAEMRLIHSLAERFAGAVKQNQLHETVHALNSNLERQVKIRTRELSNSTAIANQQRTLANILATLQKPVDVKTLFRASSHEVLQLLKVDRVAVFRFDQDWGGEFIHDYGAVSPGWEDTILATRDRWNDSYIQSTEGGRYQNSEIAVVNDIHNANLSPCHREVLEEYYIGAYIIAPLFMGETLWGLLATYQHDTPRQWEDSEINFVSQLSTHLGVALQQAESIERVKSQAKALAILAEQETTLNNVITKIRNSLELETIFKITTSEVRHLLNADRVAVFRFAPESDGKAGEIVSEDIDSAFPSAMDIVIKDKCFVSSCKDRTERREVFSIEDVENAEIKKCYREMLDSFHIKSNLVIPLFNRDALWGLLCIHQCSEARTWTDRDKEFATQIAAQLEVALQQAQLLIEAETSRETADAANQAKSLFLANMSHELRTPLNAILGIGQLLNQDKTLTPEQKKRLNIIEQSGQHLLMLINEVLDMSRIEAGIKKITPQNIHLPVFLKSLESMLSVNANSKNIDLHFELAPDLPEYIVADEGKLRQILINLLGNGVKFTHMGEVKLHVTTQDIIKIDSEEDETPIELHFEIQDTGPGIPSIALENIFEPFSQYNFNSEGNEGSGLGLTICQQLIHLMGGDISVSSQVGKGTNFKFFVPIQPFTPVLVSEKDSTSHVTPLQANSLKPKMLVVEDNKINKEVLVDFLDYMGFSIKTASNGKQAIKYWKEWQPDLIWMDMWMPIMDGYKATKKIKELGGDDAPIIIALTAHAFEEDRKVALDYGCDDFLRKPFQAQELLAMIAKHLDVEFNHAGKSSPRLETREFSILVAEDNPMNQTTITEMLSHFGQQAIIAQNGLEAVKMVQNQTFDLVLMDVNMPKMDGWEATQRIRGLSSIHQPIIVGATGSITQQEEQYCLDVGMNMTLFKPFTLEELQNVLAQVPNLLSTNTQNKSATQPQTPIKVSQIHQASQGTGNEDKPTKLNSEYFNDYQQMYGDKAPLKITEKIQHFLELMPQYITNIREGIETMDHQAVFHAAHSLKSMAGYLGGTAMMQVCQELETSAQQQSTEHYEELNHEIVIEQQRLQLALDNKLEYYADLKKTANVA